MSLVKLLEDMAGIMSMNTHLKGFLGFRGVLNLAFLCILEILHDVQKVSGSTLGLLSCQTFTLYSASSDLVDLCTNILY